MKELSLIEKCGRIGTALAIAGGTMYAINTLFSGVESIASHIAKKRQEKRADMEGPKNSSPDVKTE